MTWKIGIFLVIVTGLIFTQVLANGITGSSNRLGSNSDGITQCAINGYDINTSGAISSVTARVSCTASATYAVSATVTSGASSSTGTSNAALTAAPANVAITISPAVTIAASGYAINFTVRDP